MVSVSLLRLLGWGGESQLKKGKTSGSGLGQFNRTAKEAYNSNNNTGKKNIQNKQHNAQSSCHHPMPSALPSCD